MKKPKPKIIKRLDYHECKDYIEEKLGYKLRDTLGKFSTKDGYNSSIEYRDFWHFLVDKCNIHNGCQIWMPEPECGNEWQRPILEAFHEEFGEGPYWVSW